MKLSSALASVMILAAGLAGWILVPYPQSHQEALFYQSDFVSVPDGTLIQAAGSQEVYYAVDGHKRWIDSAGTFAAQGFQSGEIRIISSAELARYPTGEPITALTRLVLPREEKVLPDLAPLAPYDLRLATVGGRTVIKFTGSFWNKGYRPFLLLTENQSAGTAGDGSEDVYQHVQAEDGTARKKFVGRFVWHPAHNHHHYGDFAEYLFEPATMLPGTSSFGPSVRQKTTFCIRDDERMPADIPGAPAAPVFITCGKERQGVSSGWIDVYPWTLPDQYVDVNDLAPGVYALSFLIDPKKQFIEEDAGNDIATTLVELDVQRHVLRIVAALSPFPTLRNTVVDGTLLRDSESENVYVIQHGHKRLLQDEHVFGSYGYSWGSAYPVTKAMIDAIPYQQLIRRRGTMEVFLVNEQGYARHLLTPTAFASYGFTATDVADINDVDFDSYPVSQLVMRAGDTQVYLIDGATRQPVGDLVTLQYAGHDLRGLQMVSQADFDSYTQE